MTTQKQREANRRNAGNSTGPRSPEGKSRSSSNASKHGLSGGQIGLDADSRKRHLALALEATEFGYGPELAGVIAQRVMDVERVMTVYRATYDQGGEEVFYQLTLLERYLRSASSQLLKATRSD